MSDPFNGDDATIDFMEQYRARRASRDKEVEDAFRFYETPPAPDGGTAGDGGPEKAADGAAGEDGGGMTFDLADTLKQIVGGVRDAGVETLESAASMSPLGQAVEAFGGAKPDLDSVVPDVADPTSTSGAISKGVSQFVAAFIPISRAASAAGFTGKLTEKALSKVPGLVRKGVSAAVQGSGRGAVVDAVAFDEEDARISNAMIDHGFDWPIFRMLAQEDDDTTFQAKAKLAAEGLISGGVGGPVVAFALRRVGALRTLIKARANRDVALVPRAVVSQIEDTGSMLNGARERAAQVRDVQTALASGKTHQEVMDLLAKTNPKAATDFARYSQSELPTLRATADEDLAQANLTFEDMLRTVDVQPATLAKLIKQVDGYVPPSLRDEVKASKAAHDEILATKVPGGSVKTDDVYTHEAGFKPAIRMMTAAPAPTELPPLAPGKDIPSYNGKPQSRNEYNIRRLRNEQLRRTPAPPTETILSGGKSHADVLDNNIIAAGAKTENGYIRDGKFFTSDEAGPLARQELRIKPARAGDDVPRSKLIAGVFHATDQQEAALSRALSLGDVKEASDALADSFDSSNFERLTRGGGVQKALRSLTDGIQTPIDRTPEAVDARAQRMLAHDAKDFGVSIPRYMRTIDEIIPGPGSLSAKLDATRVFSEALTKRVDELAVLGADARWSTRDEADFVRYSTVLSNFNSVRAGVGEIGHGFSSLRKVGGTGAAMNNLDNLQLIIKHGSQDGQAVQVLAHRMRAASGDTVAQREILRGSLARTGVVSRILVEHYISSMLSGPTTQVVNALSNTAVGIYLPFEHLLAGGLNFNATEMHAAWKMYIGMAHGLKAAMVGVSAEGRSVAASAIGRLARFDARGARRMLAASPDSPSALRALSTGDTYHGADSPLEGMDNAAISSDSIMETSGANGALTRAFRNRGYLAKAVDTFGMFARLPLRTMTAFDEIAKSAAYHSKLYQSAFELAHRQGLRGDAADAYMRDLVSKVPRFDDPALDAGARSQFQALDEEARNYAAYATFTTELPIGSLSKKVQEAIQGHPGLRLFVPFIRTPTNIMRFVMERTPMAVFVKGQRSYHDLDSLMKETRWGVVSGDKAAQARMLMGTSISLGAMMWAMEGKITGHGPLDPDLKAGLEQSGRRDGALAMQNEDGTTSYVEISRLDPIGALILAGADIAELRGRQDEATASQFAAIYVAMIAKAFTSRTYASGFRTAVNLIDKPQQYAARFLSDTASTLMPASNLYAQIQKVMDLSVPSVDKRSFKLELGSRLSNELPGFMDTVLEFTGLLDEERAKLDRVPLRNIWGEKVLYPMGWGPDIISPFFSSTSDPNALPVREVIAKLNMPIRMNDFNSISAGSQGPGVDLSPEERSAWIQMTAGDGAMERALQARIEQDDWAGLTATKTQTENGDVRGGQETALQDVINEHKRAAQVRLLAQNTELAGRVREMKQISRAAKTTEGLKAIGSENLMEQGNKMLYGDDLRGARVNAGKLMEILQGDN